MRLFLLPISTRRTLIYCERIQETLKGGKAPLADRIIAYASKTWANWEKTEKGWQKQTTVYGNRLLKRIPYEEWGLKSIPPATKRRLKEIDEGKYTFECLYPGAFMRNRNISEILRTLATERQGLHRKKMWTCIAWMPVTAPLQLLPVIPNLPFYYLVYRAWSHYRALYGSKLLEHLVNHNLIKEKDSQEMDEMYTSGLLYPTRPTARDAEKPSEAETESLGKEFEKLTQGGKEEVMLLRRWNGKLIAEAFRLPEMEVEIERAVEQVEIAIKKAKAKKKEGTTEEQQAPTVEVEREK